MIVRNNSRRVPEELLLIEGAQVVSTYDSYTAAEHAVNVLAEQGFAVNETAIEGHGLRTVERVTGKLGYGKAMLSGAIPGVYFGFGFALIFTILNMGQEMLPVGSFVAAMLVGVGLGALLALFSYSTNRRRRNFTAIGQMVATRYDLLAPGHKVQQARQLLNAHAREAH